MYGSTSTIISLLDQRRPSRDPTGTAGLRRAARRIGKTRLTMVRAQLRLALIDRDMLGLTADAMMRYHPAAVRLEAFHAWVKDTAGTILKGNWLDAFVAAAWKTGVDAASNESSIRRMGGGARFFRPTGEADWHAISALARHELSGIVDAITQNTTRAAAKSMATRRRPAQAWRLISSVFDKIGLLRINAMINVSIVKAHNQAKLAVYREAGFNKVGIIPETIISPRPTQDAYEENPIEVGIRTAGDELVCEDCDDYANGAPYDIDEVEDTLPLHPNCRCTWYPWEDRRFSRDGVDHAIDQKG